MGLIHRIIEAAGIPGVTITLRREITASVRVPRALYLRWPIGHPLGQPGALLQQRRILTDALLALEEIREPGTIIDLPYRWRREDYSAIPSFVSSPEFFRAREAGVA